MIAIFGLGNPGKEYERTRHNAGFLVLDELARRFDASFRSKASLKSEIAETVRDGKKVLLVKPQTFMNLSGESVRNVLGNTNTMANGIVVIYDDADLPFGEVRFRSFGSSGGHNGMKSVLEALPPGTEVPRMRLGIGRPEHPTILLEDWVLGAWTAEEADLLPALVKKAADEVERWLKHRVAS